ncbi:zinc finger BED domain-containing protein RICESLEEPER 2-like [Neltuma alba]|uniref:zinc finger BED domain-containing protein RICESLEEPER 2-like n=1 Tax=Neltuma alba TaxID=207710 RepID=UPI0010A2CFA8|nr:zinc finger BED domain-containing protein RICESLEEPER 2-like [Prosopis alba]
MICEFLAPFARITELISGTSYPTSNLYFVQISKIKLLLKEFLDHDDVVIQNIAASMLEKFDKYWSDYSVILAIAIILDPRMKFDIIRFSYAQLDPVNHTEKIEHIRKKMYLVFNEYKIMDVVGSSSSTPSPIVAPNNDSCSSNASDMNIILPRTSNRPPSYPSKGGIMRHGCLNTMAFGDYLKCNSKDIASMEKSKLDFYLEEATMDPNLFLKMDVLDYWRTNAACFPCLSKMACDILSIPITTVASESAFSIGSRVLTKYRSCLLPQNVQAIICTRNWMLGFPCDDSDEEPTEQKDDGSQAQPNNFMSSNHASNSNTINIDGRALDS